VLIKRYAKLDSRLRAAIDTTAEAGDADTNDLLIGFSRARQAAFVLGSTRS
jgi:starvation-inducible DNA-binding protein